MIAHVSIPAVDPKATALFFAKLIDGKVFPFLVIDGAWITVASDRSGLAIEVYPRGMVHHPGAGEVDPKVPIGGPKTQPWEDQIYAEKIKERFSSHHVAISTKLSLDEVIALGKEAGYRTVHCDRGGVFGVVEVWIDNELLIEVLTPDDYRRYTHFMNPQAAAQFFGEAIN